MHPVIEPAERAVLEEKLRTVLGSGAATTALLKIVDAVIEAIELRPVEPQTALDIVAEEPTSPVDTGEVTGEVQVVESSP